MSFSRGGKTQTSTSSNATNISQPINLQDTEGVALGYVGGGVSIQSSDYGAIERASDIATASIEEVGAASQGALRFGEDTVNAALSFGQGAFRSAEDSARNALAFGSAAIDAATESAIASGDVARNALSYGRDVTDSAIGAVANTAQDSAALAVRTTENALAFGESAFGTVENALGRLGSAYENAASVQGEALAGVVDLADRNTSRIAQISEGAISATSEAAGSFFDKALSFAASLSSKQQSTLGETVSALNAVAVENSKSTDQRVAELAEGSQKTILIALGIAVAGVLGFAMFRRG